MDVRRETTPVQQEDHLVLFAEALVHGDVQLAPDRSVRERVANTQIHGRNGGEDTVFHTVRQSQKLIIASPGVPVRLQRGRSRAEQNQRVFHLSPLDRHFPGVVPRSHGVLLETRFVLLVDDDQPKARRWGKNGTPRTDDHFHVAVKYPLPLVVALRVGQM